MHVPNDVPIPIDAWLADMNGAIDRICEIRTATLNTHRKASDKAATNADHWKLAERADEERAALHHLLRSAYRVIEAIECTRKLMRADDTADVTVHQSMHDCAEAIDAALPEIEQSLLTIRQSALDLLVWTQHSAYIEGSELPAQYRASYAKLVTYTPILKPRLEAMQQELLSMTQDARVHPNVRLLLTALIRYNAVADSARAFVKRVVEPPLELVFEDTDVLQADWQNFAPADQARLATAINDCCQCLLFDPAEFDRRVDGIQPQLINGMDASLFVLPAGDVRILFTVDEDPVFEQLTVTLLRVVYSDQFDAACTALTQSLYGELTNE